MMDFIIKARSTAIVYNNNFNKFNNQNKTFQNNNSDNKFARDAARGRVFSGPKTGKHINAPEVRLIDENDENLGIVSLKDAIAKADEAGLDLIEIVPNATPPVAKIMDFGKWKYEESKKKSEMRKKQKTADIKELKFSSNIEENDYQVKLRNGKKFISEGDKVKISLRFRGREIANKEMALQMLRTRLYDMKIQEHLAQISSKRKTMVSTGDRSAKIRTYNYPQGRITDHRINYTIYNLSAFMDGEIQDCIDHLIIAENAERLKEAEL